MEAAGFILSVLGGLLLGFPYAIVMGPETDKGLENAAKTSTALAAYTTFGLLILLLGAIFHMFEIDAPRNSDLDPLPLKTLFGGVVALVIAAVWWLTTTIAKFYKAGSRALPAQLLGAMLLFVGGALTVGHILTK